LTEADEYPCSFIDKHPKFYYQDPNYLVITNLAYDHPDIYKNAEDTTRVFLALVERVPSDGLIIANGDSQMARNLFKKHRPNLLLYGTESNNDVVISNQVYHLSKTGFDLSQNYKSASFAIKLAGDMNVHNACAAVLISRAMGLSDSQIQTGLNQYRGVSRRMEIIHKFKTSILIDDYAHHPDEIKATISTLRKIYPKKKIVVIFQPHTYSRTKSLFDQFTQSFRDCDTVLLADIYGSAREKSDVSVSSEILTDEINKINKNANYIKNFAGFLEYTKNRSLSNTVLVTVGAGDIFSWHEAIIDKIKKSYNRWVL